jgi:hypothetical protein
MRGITALTGGIAAVLMVSACGSDQSLTEPSISQDATAGFEAARGHKSVSLIAGVDGIVRDGTTVLDGSVVQALHVPQFEDRGVIEFDISGISGHLTRAKLNLSVYASNGPYPFTINVFAYPGDGVLSSSDWDTGTLITTFKYAGATSVMLDVKAALRALARSGATFAGFRFEFAVPSSISLNGPFIAFNSNEYGPAAILQLIGPHKRKR